jgi:hypothetical protein
MQTLRQLSEKARMNPGRAMEMPDRMENEETKTRFPFVSHRPWKSLRDSHIPTARLLLLPFPLKTKTKTKGGLAAELHSSFRLIVGLENAARARLGFVL